MAVLCGKKTCRFFRSIARFHAEEWGTWNEKMLEQLCTDFGAAVESVPLLTLHLFDASLA